MQHTKGLALLCKINTDFRSNTIETVSITNEYSKLYGSRESTWQNCQKQIVGCVSSTNVWTGGDAA